MVENWNTSEGRTWKPPSSKVTQKPTKTAKFLKPTKDTKLKESVDEKNGKKPTAPPPVGVRGTVANVLSTITGRIGGLMAKGKVMQAKMRANKVVPFESKVQARHLELEPLCCLSSCLVRGGCTAVIAFEAFYLLATLFIIFGRVSAGGFTLWEPLPQTFNAWFGHHLFYYSIFIYDLVLFCFIIVMARGLMTFSKVLLNAHYVFCYVSLVVNFCFFVFSVWTLSTTGPYKWTPTNCLIVFCFAMQIPLQIWAITVVKSCRDFFSLIRVFIAIAEA
ncbi:hypothetical protein DICVIV_13708 [Dictyocaulus viviparus]|uniref:Uncharacterized protein n=1 Tax=Dictyocaulus viviparus TaxID=29172 RepID=A0A0D8XD49_DICVI|nr:hypothetical protein DICVIV_13708 [Dictyocaulus viviparus]